MAALARRLRLAVLVSGRGTNLRALIEACAAPGFPAEVALVLSNRPDAKALAVAADHGIPARLIDHTRFANRESFDEAMSAAIEEAGAELVCLAGFMRLLSAPFVRRWANRVINIHPSLLPVFKGLNVHARVLESGVRFSGCTVHFVRPELDEGPIIVQGVVPVHPNDTEKTLSERVLNIEHRCYPLAVRLIAEGHARVHGNTVKLDRFEPTELAILNPPEP